MPYSRCRGHHFLTHDEEGEIKCVACELCARICPCDCIEVIPYEDERARRHPGNFEIDKALVSLLRPLRGCAARRTPDHAFLLSVRILEDFPRVNCPLNATICSARRWPFATGGDVISAPLV